MQRGRLGSIGYFVYNMRPLRPLAAVDSREEAVAIVENAGTHVVAVQPYGRLLFVDIQIQGLEVAWLCRNGAFPDLDKEVSYRIVIRCRNKNVVSFGPSYRQTADKYPQAAAARHARGRSFGCTMWTCRNRIGQIAAVMHTTPRTHACTHNTETVLHLLSSVPGWRHHPAARRPWSTLTDALLSWPSWLKLNSGHAGATHTYTHTRTHTQTHARAKARIHARTPVRTHARTRTHALTHARMHEHCRLCLSPMPHPGHPHRSCLQTLC